MITVWSDERIAWLFTEVTKRFGCFDMDTWGQLPSYASGFDFQIDIEETLSSLYDDFVLEFSSDISLRLPKSEKAVEQQIRWATTNQPPCSLSVEQRRLQQRNRLIAYKVGFMTMSDILALETGN